MSLNRSVYQTVHSDMEFNPSLCFLQVGWEIPRHTIYGQSNNVILTILCGNTTWELLQSNTLGPRLTEQTSKSWFLIRFKASLILLTKASFLSSSLLYALGVLEWEWISPSRRSCNIQCMCKDHQCVLKYGIQWKLL